jgi:hypothetical protein
MGADGHIAIYDWEKVREYLLSRKDKYIPKVKVQVFPMEQLDDARRFVDSLRAKGWLVSSMVRRSGGLWMPLAIDNDLVGYDEIRVRYYDEDDKEPPHWPGYVCDWTCNGKQACLVYWGDNLDTYPFEGCEWLEEWADSNACLVPDQEVWT